MKDFLKLVAIVYLSCTSSSVGQTIVKPIKTVDSARIDTISILSIQDSMGITQQELTNSRVKIFIQPINNNIDYFKYIFPIITLMMGIGINKLLDYFSQRKKVKKTAERWAAEIRHLETPMVKQIESISLFIEENKADKFDTPKLNVYSTLDCQIFNSLDKSELFKALEGKEDYSKAVLYSNRIHNYISIISYNYDNLKLRFEQYRTGASKQVEQFTQSLQLVSKAFANYGVALEKELNTDPREDSRYKPLLELFDKEIRPFVDEGNFDIYRLEKYFFIPMIRILSQSRKNDNTKELLTYSTDCINAIKGIKMEKRYLIENFGNIKARYQELLDELDSIVKQLV